MSAPPGGPRPGELLDRFLARLIDFILVGIVDFIIGTVLVVGVLMGSSGSMYSVGTSFAVGAVSAIISTLITVGYFTYMEATQGKTVGKMLMKLHTEGPNGGNPTYQEAFMRNIWTGLGILGIIPVVGGLIGALGELVAVIMIAVGISGDTVNRQAFHDRLAGGTRVIKEG
jgi:uncharacterized RDD family membrane protein YckC